MICHVPPQPRLHDQLTVQRGAKIKHQRLEKAKEVRSGIATVELAVVLPILLLLVLGTVEVCQRLYLKQSATIAAYESIRLAARRTSNAQDVINRCNQLLTDRRLTHGEIILNPTNFGNLKTGSPISIEVIVPWASNSATRFVLRDQGRISVKAIMLRE